METTYLTPNGKRVKQSEINTKNVKKLTACIKCVFAFNKYRCAFCSKQK